MFDPNTSEYMQNRRNTADFLPPPMHHAPAMHSCRLFASTINVTPEMMRQPVLEDDVGRDSRAGLIYRLKQSGRLAKEDTRTPAEVFTVAKQQVFGRASSASDAPAAAPGTETVCSVPEYTAEQMNDLGARVPMVTGNCVTVRVSIVYRIFVVGLECDLQGMESQPDMDPEFHAFLEGVRNFPCFTRDKAARVLLDIARDNDFIISVSAVQMGSECVSVIYTMSPFCGARVSPEGVRADGSIMRGYAHLSMNPMGMQRLYRITKGVFQLVPFRAAQPDGEMFMFPPPPEGQDDLSDDSYMFEGWVEDGGGQASCGPEITLLAVPSDEVLSELLLMKFGFLKAVAENPLTVTCFPQIVPIDNSRVMMLSCPQTAARGGMSIHMTYPMTLLQADFGGTEGTEGDT